MESLGRVENHLAECRSNLNSREPPLTNCIGQFSRIVIFCDMYFPRGEDAARSWHVQDISLRRWWQLGGRDLPLLRDARCYVCELVIANSLPLGLL